MQDHAASGACQQRDWPVGHAQLRHVDVDWVRGTETSGCEVACREYACLDGMVCEGSAAASEVVAVV